MTDSKLAIDEFVDKVPVHSQSKKVDILAIGETSEWAVPGRPLPEVDEVAFAAFHDVTEALLRDVQPNMIVSPLLTAGFDCIELAQLLSTLKYEGAYRALTQALPSPEIVVREIGNLCPGLDFDVIEMPEIA